VSELAVKQETPRPVEDIAVAKPQQSKKLPWETPKLEDVSEQVMAQPYIRFT